MARLIQTPTGGGLVGSFEPKVLEFLLSCLPDDYAVAPNVQLKPRDADALEYDFIALAPHAIYVVEAKEWYGRLTGDDSEWLLNQKPRKCPLWLVNRKCQVLKTELGALGRSVYVAPVLVIPDGTTNHLGGNWGSHVRSQTGLCSYLQEPQHLQRTNDPGVNPAHIEQVLQGKWGARQRAKRTRFGGYEVAETLYSDERSSEYVGRRWLFEGDPNRYRIRTWRLEPSLSGDARDRQLVVIKRPTEAVSKIGPHPNLLQVLQFEFIDEDNLFFEVTEWSELGTLHGFLTNKDRDRLTLRERLEIAEGVANALTAVHEAGVVHRNVSPQTILLGFDRRPHLTDFDRAFIESGYTVFPKTTTVRTDPAYVAPELEDSTDYDFDTAADMYSLGVLLYKLLTDQVPFQDAAAARAKHGRPERLPSELADGVSAELDALVLRLLHVEDYRQRPSAEVVGAQIRSELGRTTGSAAGVAPPPVVRTAEKLEVGSILKGTMRVDAELGAGGIGKVLKIFHLDHQRHYALKVLFDDSNADLLLREFNHIKPLLPVRHQHIAEIVWMDRLDPPDRRPYLLTEFVDGETLEKYCDGTKPLAWTDIHRIGSELLGALVALHPDDGEYQRLRLELQGRDLDYEEYEQLQYAQERAQRGIFHRDIKPANIMLAMPDHRAVMIDFNISSLASEDDSTGRTPKYCPPDWLNCSRASYDLFSLGVVLYELVTHRHPYKDNNPTVGEPYPPNEITTFRVGDALSDFLSRAVQPDENNRFSTAQDMRAAWAELPSMYAPAEQTEPPGETHPGITLQPEERERRDYNPYVTRLLTLYSQARRSNAGTRGLDDIARLTYVQTWLDEKLAPAIVSGRFRLVLITGNAGDGKTAFLQQVQSLFEQNGAAVEELPTQNGARWTFNGVYYESNYDGSQDEGDRENDTVLEEFFAPFAGADVSVSGTQARLIAINEGRLIDFLQHSDAAPRFQGLKRFVLDALDGRAPALGTLLVNLNVRAVTAHGDKSLLEKQLQRFLQPELWTPCRRCSLKDKCPIKHNVDSLGDPTAGVAVRRRIRRLFEVVHLRRRMHVTMRDLRSALSYLLLRDTSCTDVAQLVSHESDGLAAHLQARYYPNVFAGDHLFDEATEDMHGDRTVDRLVRRLREVDVGLVNDPALDRRLDHSPASAVPWMTFDARSAHAMEVLHALQRDVPEVGDGSDIAGAIQERRRLLASWRRWAFFERRDDGWQDMLPYRSLELLERVAESSDSQARTVAVEKLRDAVIDAISLSEGVRSPEVRAKYLALRISRVQGATTRSYRLFPKGAFHVRVVAPAGVGEYLEYSPDAVELVARGDQSHASLRISLDLLEMLMLIASGYRPTTSDLQGLFVNLLIFRNELLTSTFSEVLVTADDHDFYKLSAKGSRDGIELAIDKVEELSSAGGGA